MKIRWWIIGALAAAAATVLVVKHLGESKNETIGNFDGESGKKISESPAGIPSADSEEIDFLV
jgi:hypothetical protein